MKKHTAIMPQLIQSLHCIAAVLLLVSGLQAQTTIFQDNFSSNTLGPKWTTNIGSPNGVIDIATGIGFENTRAVRMGKTSSQGGYVVNALDLKLDLSTHSQVALTFKIKDISDDTDQEDGLFLSDDGGANFEQVFFFHPSDWCNEYGEFPPFDIDALASQYGLSLNSQFVIRFQQKGEDYLPYYDGFYIDDVKVYAPVLTYETLPFSDNFEASALKTAWTWPFADQTNTLASIATRPSSIMGVGGGIGIGNSRALVLGKGCSDGAATTAADLHLNLANQPQVAMTFSIKDISDDTDVDDAIYFSNDGGANFTRVFSFHPSDWCNEYGQYPPLDIDALAAQYGLTLTSTFVIRFQQHGDDYLPYYDGFYIDDVNVYAPVLTYAALPFSDNFEANALKTAWTWPFADQTNTLANIATRPSSIMGIGGGIGINNSRALVLGKGCSDGAATTAADLHLNLANQPQVAMTFSIKDISDDTDVDDAIYFSNDGGANFTRVFSFHPSDWCNEYGQYPPLDIDALANQYDVPLSGNFVIRFQQHGDDYLPYYDGFYIDDVNVYVPELTYAPLPFSDNFEANALKTAWTWPFADQTNTLATIVTRPSSIMGIGGGIGINNSRALVLGKGCSDGAATTAADLHLNLANQTQVMLTYQLKDISDDTDVDDAIYFSNDGGANFIRVHEFDFSNTANDFNNYSLNISNVAAQNGIALSSQFVVRFQQHGDNYLPYYDGIYIDNINITGVVGTNTLALDGHTVQIFPNPTADFLNINMEQSNIHHPVTYTLSNVLGQTVLEHTSPMPTQQLDIAHLTKGYYCLTIRTAIGYTSTWVIKQ